MLHELEVWARFIALLLAVVVAVLQAIKAYRQRRWRSAMAICTIVVLLIAVVLVSVVLR